MTDLVYFEPHSAGHCTFWADLVITTALRDTRVDKIRLFAPPELIARLEEKLADPRLAMTPLSENLVSRLTTGSLMRRGMAQWAQARALLAQQDGAICFLPIFDQAVMGAIFDRRPVRGRIGGIIFRPPNFNGMPITPHSAVEAVWRWAMYLGATRPALARLMTLDEMAANTSLGGAISPLVFVPDPAPDLSLFAGRRRRLRSDGRLVMLLFGSLAERKGSLALLEALPLLTRERRSQIVVRLVGRVLDAEREMFEAALARAQTEAPEVVIELLDHYVSDAELAQEVVDCDIVLAPYQNHVGSSGALYWAAAAGRPVITQNSGLMGYQVGRYSLGRCVNTTDREELAKALEETPPFVTESAADFIRNHTPAAFAGGILDCLLGNPSLIKEHRLL